MRVLFTIPHFYRPSSDSARHGSESTQAREARRRALDTTIFQLHDLFGQRRYAAQHHQLRMIPAANPLAMDFEIVVCTSGDDHLLGELESPSSMYTHYATNGDPKFLGWECHAVLKQSMGMYDYYCYLEDDIVVTDPFFFRKLELVNDYFATTPGGWRLLQPQRFETALGEGADRHALAHRLYMDYQTAERSIYAGDPVVIEYLGVEFRIEPALHPHAGCFFLNHPQMEHLAQQPIFLDRQSIWVTPLDTAATLAIARTFQIFKPALESMQFLEVRHAHPVMLHQLYPSGGPVPDWRF